MIADDPHAHYDRVTDAWGYIMGRDLHYGYFKPPTENLEAATRALTMEMASAAKIVPDKRVLEVGCGTGLVAALLVQRFGCQVVGISPSERCVQISRRNAESLCISDRVTFEQRDGMNNGFPNESFDRVWVMESSHLMDDLDQLLSESIRVLKPGGRIALCDIIAYRDLSLTEVLEGAKSFDLLKMVFGRAKIKTLDAYKDALTRSGFSNNVIQDISERAKPTFAYWKKNISQHKASIDHMVGKGYSEEFAFACDILDSMWRKGVFGYAIFAAEK